MCTQSVAMILNTWVCFAFFIVNTASLTSGHGLTLNDAINKSNNSEVDINSTVHYSSNYDLTTLPPKSSYLNDLFSNQQISAAYYANQRDLTYESTANTDKIKISAFLNENQPYAVITKFVDQLAERIPVASAETIGLSYEGRDLKVIKIGLNGGDELKPIIYITCGSHENSSLTTTTALYVADALISGYDSNEEIKTLLSAFEFHIVPLSNPDGYEYAYTTNASWSKSRSKYSASTSVGTFIDDNWDIDWCGNRTKPEQCLEASNGQFPFSEIESHLLSNYMWRYKDRIKLFLYFFDRVKVWCTPYGYTKLLPLNYNSLVAKAKVAVNAIAKVNGTQYKVTNTVNGYKMVSGMSVDWALDVAGIPYAYNVGLRRTGKFGTGVQPKSEIRPNVLEKWAGIKAIAFEMLKEHREDNLRNLNTGCRCKAKSTAAMI